MNTNNDPSNKGNQQLPNIMGYIQGNNLPPVNSRQNMLINGTPDILNRNNDTNNNNNHAQNQSNFQNNQLPAVMDSFSNDDTETNHNNNNNNNNNADWKQRNPIVPAKRRVSKACDHCRKRKIKCDDIDPASNKCSNCMKYNAECTFIHHDNPPKKKKKKNATKNDNNNAVGRNEGNPNADTSNNLSSIDSFVATPDMLRMFPDNSSHNNNSHQNISTQAMGNSNEPLAQHMTYNSHLRTSSNIMKQINNEYPSLASPSPDNGNIAQENTTNYGNQRANISVNGQISSNKGPGGDETVINRMEQVDRKVSMVIDTMARFEWLVDKLSKKVDDRLPKPSNLPKAKHKQYFSKLLTTQKLEWVKSVVAEDESNSIFLAPIKDFMTVNLKWYILQCKHMIEYPMILNFRDENRLDMPSKEHAKILLGNFNTIIKYHSSIMTQDEIMKLYEKYYENDTSSLTYGEHLVLNICLAICANICICDPHEFFREDPENEPTLQEYQNIEKMTFENAMYYYHKLVLFSAGATAITGLLMLFHYLNFNYNCEFAVDALALAIRYAYDMNLNMNFHYKSLAPNEVIKHRALWWYCFYFDKMVSLMLSKPPLIKENDMDILANDVYFETIKYYQLPQHFKNNPGEIDKITNLNDALSAIINYSEHFPFFVSFYSTKLITIESEIGSVCFSIRNTIDYTFDDIVQKILDIRTDLTTWRESLHPSMRLESYNQYLKMLYAQSPSKSSKLGLEVSCFQVIKCHLHYLYLDLTLSCFAISFLLDNTDLFTSSSQSLPETFHSFCRQIKMDCIQICKIFQKVPFKPYLYPELLCYVLTGVYTLLFHVIKYMDDPKEIDIPKLISLLISAHNHVVGENYSKVPSTNVKVNAAIFHFTFLLKYIIKHYNDKGRNVDEEKFEYLKYDDLMKKLIENIQERKTETVKSIVEQVRDTDQDKNDRWSQFKFHDNSTVIDPTLPPIEVGIFGMFSNFTPELLELLDSPAAFESVFNERDLKALNDPSLYTSLKLPATLLFSIHAKGDIDEGYKQEQLKKLGDMKNTFSFCSQLPLGKLLFDRDFMFIKYLNKERKEKISY
ncbi:similar to Saccharomyces cerevisiae YBR150C TBS1 Putative protein of unknown function [Maudiozyma barnettii]|mgnify:CR=1 FL=1|uniref:Zn(2)-C6 fungal-type domain-containing protein n=1 Tax=Maudiozyma barnettii TaxID=61262 RepID=A0A8H2VJN0_9SACH|nr:uncharacterized protein KABA2_10S03344 [Kazachstania barnettii]CAB4256618.1 similar to Saccharomyces cerevisiae YBR150C TBS1 Putative protein of unknown function [Kazachstania barnettii]CAD1785221.1 similar to Saccharomyces cerevisiae YBR150C TBS1 Putative protein of unknown function [Kazachstania barnettii]